MQAARGMVMPTMDSERRYAPSTDRPAVLDLAERADDVRRIARSLPQWRACVAAGWDPDDLESEVLCRVVARQGMGSRYDPARAGVGKYLHLLCGSILSNLREKLRTSEREGLTDDGSIEGGEWPEYEEPVPVPRPVVTRVGVVLRRAAPPPPLAPPPPRPRVVALPPGPRKRPCGVCRRWFAPRVATGRVCSDPACQRERHRRACVAGRKRDASAPKVDVGAPCSR